MVHYLQIRCREDHPQRPTAEQSAHIWTDTRALPPRSQGLDARQDQQQGPWRAAESPAVVVRTQHRLRNQRAQFTRWQIKSFKDLTFLFFPLL